MLRAIVGLIKGSIVGGGVAYGLLRFGVSGAVMTYLACAGVGAIVGVVCGRAPWRSETLWTPLVKMIVGAGIGVGLCALGLKVLPDTALATVMGTDLTMHSGAALVLGVGLLYGLFVEVDDGGKQVTPPTETSKKK